MTTKELVIIRNVRPGEERDGAKHDVSLRIDGVEVLRATLPEWSRMLANPKRESIYSGPPRAA